MSLRKMSNQSEIVPFLDRRATTTCSGARSRGDCDNGDDGDIELKGKGFNEQRDTATRKRKPTTTLTELTTTTTTKAANGTITRPILFITMFTLMLILVVWNFAYFESEVVVTADEDIGGGGDNGGSGRTGGGGNDVDVNDPFDVPFCDLDGTCHEKPDQPSPRTIYSAWNKEQYDNWWIAQEKLNRTAELYGQHRRNINNQQQQHQQQQQQENEQQGGGVIVVKSIPFILLGDSITESWAGTRMGQPSKKYSDIPQVLKEELTTNPIDVSSSSSSVLYSQILTSTSTIVNDENNNVGHDNDNKQNNNPIVKVVLDPLILAISGDQTQHLLYRLQHGQLLPEYSTDKTSIYVVLIGTNNLGSGELPAPQTSNGILAVVKYLLSHIKGGHVIVMKLLPRGDGKNVLPKLCPPRCSKKITTTDNNNNTNNNNIENNYIPYDSFLPAIDKVNEAITIGIESLKEEYPAAATYPNNGTVSKNFSRVGLVDCGTQFLNKNYKSDHVKRNGGKNGDGDEPKEEEVDITLMPDLLHPNAEGHRILAKCLLQYMKNNIMLSN